MLFYSKENQVPFARLAVIFSPCISLKRHAGEVNHPSFCLSFENLCALHIFLTRDSWLLFNIVFTF